jgi:hypothetical protein
MAVLLLRPEPHLPAVVVFAVFAGTLASVGTYRGEVGKVALPDSVLLTLFLVVAGFWIWVLLTGHDGLAVGGWSDAVAATIVMALPVGGVALVVWNRITTRQDLLSRAAAEK